jgi:hypothetical protein
MALARGISRARRRLGAALLLAAVALALAAAVWRLTPPALAPPPQGLTLWQVTVVNPGAERLEGQTIVIRGGEIESIAGSSGAITADVRRQSGESTGDFARRLAVAQRFAGAYVLPGLIETGVEYPSRWSGLRAYFSILFLDFGVTTVQLAASDDGLRRLAREIAEGGAAGPRLLPPPLSPRSRGAEPPIVLGPVEVFTLPPSLWHLLPAGDAVPRVPGLAAWRRLAAIAAVHGEGAAWAAATSGAAEGLGVPGLGVVRTGAPADLLLVREVPALTAGLHASLAAVVAGGRLYSRRRLDEQAIKYQALFSRPSHWRLARWLAALRDR